MKIRGVGAGPARFEVIGGYAIPYGAANAVALQSGFLAYLNSAGNPVFVGPKPGKNNAYPSSDGFFTLRRLSGRWYTITENQTGNVTGYEYPSILDQIMSTGFYSGDGRRVRNENDVSATVDPMFLNVGTPISLAPTPPDDAPMPVDPVRTVPIYDPPVFDVPTNPPPALDPGTAPAPAPAPSGSSPSGGGSTMQANEWYFDPVYDSGGGGGQVVDVTGEKMSPWPILLAIAAILVAGSRKGK